MANYVQPEDYQVAMEGAASSDSVAKKLVRMVEDDIRVSHQNVISKRRGEWNKSELSFLVKIDQRELDQMRATGIPTFDDPFEMPIIHTYITSLAAATFQIYSERDPRISLMARRADDEESVGKMELVLNYQHQRGRGDLVMLYRMIHDRVYGHSPRKTVWDEDAQINRTYWWDPFLFFWDPLVPVTEIHRGRFVAFQSTSHRVELMRAGIYFNLSKLKKASKTFMDNFGYGLERDLSRDWGQGTIRNTVFGIPTSADGGETTALRGLARIDPYACILHEDWRWIVPSEFSDALPLLPEMDPDEPVMTRITVANGNTLIGLDYSDFRHNQFPSGVISDSTDGMTISPPGIAEINRGPYRYVNWLCSSRKDAVQKTLNPRTVFNPTLIDPEDLQTPFPGQLIPLRPEHYTDDVRKALYEVPVEDTTGGHLTDAQFFMQYMERDTAATEPVQGVQSAGARTATELSIVAKSAQGRHGLTMRKYDLQDNEDLVMQMVANTKAFMRKPVYVRMTASIDAKSKSSPGESLQQAIFPEDLENVEADYVPFNPKKMMFGERKADSLMLLRQNILATGPEYAARFDLQEIDKDIAEASGVTDFERYVIPVPGPMEQQQQMPPQASPAMLPGPPMPALAGAPTNGAGPPMPALAGAPPPSAPPPAPPPQFQPVGA